MTFLLLGVKRSDKVTCRQSLLLEDTDVMRSHDFMLHLMIIEVALGGLESGLVYQIVNTSEEEN